MKLTSDLRSDCTNNFELQSPKVYATCGFAQIEFRPAENFLLTQVACLGWLRWKILQPELCCSPCLVSNVQTISIHVVAFHESIFFRSPTPFKLRVRQQRKIIFCCSFISTRDGKNFFFVWKTNKLAEIDDWVLGIRCRFFVDTIRTLTFLRCPDFVSHHVEPEKRIAKGILAKQIYLERWLINNETKWLPRVDCLFFCELSFVIVIGEIKRKIV